MKRTVLLLMALASLGCGSSPPPGPVATDRTERNYTIGVEVQATVGSPFITSERIQQHWYRTNAGAWFSERQIDRHELLYSGRDGKTPLVTYREYSATDSYGAQAPVNLLARPAFSQELRYDLAASDAIVFREYRIRVAEATNESIRVVVVADGTETQAQPN
jgi:hypothetical protein